MTKSHTRHENPVDFLVKLIWLMQGLSDNSWKNISIVALLSGALQCQGFESYHGPRDRGPTCFIKKLNAKR